MKTIRERDVERYLVEQVKKLGGEVRKVAWVGRRGAPDRLVMLPVRRLSPGLDCAWCNPHGLGIWVELKAPGVPPEDYQLREHKRMRKMGQRVEVVDSYAAIDELLKG